MNLLIVDDEYYSAKGIQTQIVNASLGLEGIMCAYSAAQAKQIIIQRRVDILITDIQMPKGSGLELTAWCRQEYPDIVCIFLTAYATFDYASTAVKLQGFDYLLKPVEEEKLLNCVRAAMIRSEQITAQMNQREQAEYWKNALSNLIEQFFLDLGQGKIPDKKELIEAELKKRNLPATLSEQRLFPVFIRHWPQEKTLTDQGFLVDELKKCLHKESLGSEDTGIPVAIVGDSIFLAIFPITSSREDTVPLLRGLHKRCEGVFQGNLLICVASDVKPADFRCEYEKLLKHIHNQIVPRNGIDDLALSKTRRGSASLLPVQVWTDLILTGRHERLLEEVSYCLESHNHPTSMDRNDLMLFYHDFLQILYSVMDKFNACPHELLDAQLPQISYESACDSIEDMKQWIKQTLNNLSVCIQQNNSAQSAIAQVCLHIDQNLSENLDRERLATLVYLSPDYLSHLFRAQKGISLTQYIIDQRIKRAKELLLTTGQCIRNITQACGFQSESYFAKQFKRSVGYTPQAFRKAR